MLVGCADDWIYHNPVFLLLASHLGGGAFQIASRPKLAALLRPHVAGACAPCVHTNLNFAMRSGCCLRVALSAAAAVGGAVPLMPARRSRGKSTGALIMSITI
jgi:hypothetical protein